MTAAQNLPTICIEVKPAPHEPRADQRLPLPGESLGQAALRRARTATALHLSQAASLVHQVELARMRAEAGHAARRDAQLLGREAAR